MRLPHYLSISAVLAAALPVCAQDEAAAAPSPAPADEWRQWLGPGRDGHSPDRGLLKEWPKDGPRLVWKASGLGPGFSAVTFAGERMFTMGDFVDDSRILALRVSDGSIEWSAKLGEAGGKRNEGPRATPATDGERVYGLGQDGELACAEVATGKIVWRHNLPADFGGKMMSGWGYSESPLLDGELLVCMPGGPDGTVLALDKRTGETVWRSKELTDAAPYTSLLPIDLGGVRQYVAFTDRSVAGIEASSGKLLWRADRRGRTAICSTPVYHDGVLFVSSDYDIGCNAFRIAAEDGVFTATQIYAGKQMMSHHGGLVLVGDHVYGLGRRNLKCIDLRSGDVVWEEHSVGKGSITYADGNLIVRSERDGAIALVEATPDGYREKGRLAQPDRTHDPAWSYPVVYGGRLYVRDQDLLLCYDVSATK